MLVSVDRNRQNWRKATGSPLFVPWSLAKSSRTMNPPTWLGQSSLGSRLMPMNRQGISPFSEVRAIQAFCSTCSSVKLLLESPLLLSPPLSSLPPLSVLLPSPSFGSVAGSHWFVSRLQTRPSPHCASLVQSWRSALGWQLAPPRIMEKKHSRLSLAMALRGLAKEGLI